jgi:lipoprotein-anchoring transpeptidase ErfK/SrfK
MYINEKMKHRIHHILAGIILIAGTLGIIYGVQAYPQVFRIGAKIESNQEIMPEQEIKITFSEPMIASQIISSVRIVPRTETSFRWEEGNKKLIITPDKFWEPGETYGISISGAKSIMLTEINADFQFRTIEYPEIAEFYPASEAKDVALDIEDPIKATFTKPIEDFRVKFVIQPFRELIYQLDSAKKEVELLSKEDLERGKKYDITVSIRYKGAPEEDYRKIYTTSFETKPLPPTTWEKDLNLRLEQARRFSEPKISSGKYIDINVKSQVMTIFENGKLLDAYLVSTGKRGMDTHQGQFAVSNKFPRAWSKKYGLFMPFWMAMVPSGEFGIHELPEWPGGYKEGQNHLGIPVSHGCIRLGVGPAERVYNWAELKTPVVIHE